jgi:hypothetical protein
MPKPRIDISSRQISPTESQAGDIDLELPTQSQQAPARRGKRVELVALSRILPDEFQARTLLPSAIASPFFRFEIDCFQAAADWVELAKSDPGIRRRVDDLLALGMSLESDGQIKAITGSWQNLGGRTVFLLETGERRFWGTVLRAVISQTGEDPLIEAVSVPEPSRVRQVIENEKYETPNAISRARAVAALILDFNSMPPQHGEGKRFDYHRQALGVRVSGKTWAEIERVIGIGRPALVRHLQLLELPDPLLELADTYGVPERVLREVRQLPQTRWENALVTAIQEGLSSEEVQLLESPTPPAHQHAAPHPAEPSIKAARHIIAALAGLDEEGGLTLGAVADSLFFEFKSPTQVLHAVEMLETLARQLRLRVQK